MEKSNMPFDLTLIVTYNCNLNCVYCYEHNKQSNEHMSLEVAKNSITHYMESGDYEDIRISFIGGEPLLEFELIKKTCEWFWHQQWRKKFLFFATTNGTIMTHSMKEWFTEHKNSFWLSLSLDGGKETHNRNRCNSFDRIDLDFFLKNWPNQPVKMTITDSNLENLAEDIIYIHERGFKLNGCNFAEGVEMCDFENKYRIIAEQYEKLIPFYLNHPEYESPLFELPFGECETRTRVKQKRCGTGENMAVVDVDGKIYPCTYFSPVSMNKESLLKILKTDFLDQNNFIDLNCLSNCYIYPICHGCYGDNYSLTGNLATRSSQKCELNKLRIAAASKYTAIKMQKKLQNATEISKKDMQIINAIQKVNQMFN